MVGATIGISRPSQRDLPKDFAQYATAGRFWQLFIRPNLAVTAQYANGCHAQTLRELPTLVNGLEAKS
jgi:hypothetical protein